MDNVDYEVTLMGFAPAFGKPFREPFVTAGAAGGVPVVLVISPDYDTFVQDTTPVTSYATATQFILTAVAPARYGLIWPNLAALAGRTIISATLTLTASTNHAAADKPVAIYRILVANNGWLETCTWNFADGAGATDRWAGDAGGDGGADAGCSVSGTDYNAVAIGSFTIPGGTLAGTVFNVALNVAQFQAQVAANYGWVMRGAFSTVWLATSDHATVGWRPYLTVTYT